MENGKEKNLTLNSNMLRSTDNFFVLLDNLFDNLLHHGLALVFRSRGSILGQLGIVHILRQSVDLLVLGQELLLLAEPGGPLAENTLPRLDHGRVGDVHRVPVLLVELLGVLAKVLAHLLLLFLAEERGGARAPEELLEFVGGVLGKGLTGEGVEGPAIFHLEIGVSDSCLRSEEKGI